MHSAFSDKSKFTLLDDDDRTQCINKNESSSQTNNIFSTLLKKPSKYKSRTCCLPVHQLVCSGFDLRGLSYNNNRPFGRHSKDYQLSKFHLSPSTTTGAISKRRHMVSPVY